MLGTIVKGQKDKEPSWRKKLSAKPRWNLQSRILVMSFTIQNGR